MNEDCLHCHLVRAIRNWSSAHATDRGLPEGPVVDASEILRALARVTAALCHGGDQTQTLAMTLIFAQAMRDEARLLKDNPIQERVH